MGVRGTKFSVEVRKTKGMMELKSLKPTKFILLRLERNSKLS